MESYSLELCLSPMTSSRQDSTVSDHSSGRDHVEIQIRAIIEMASRQREVTALELAPVKSPLGSSVKRSVKRFLDKRKKRNKSVTPDHSYTYSTSTSSSSSSSSSHNF